MFPTDPVYVISCSFLEPFCANRYIATSFIITESALFSFSIPDVVSDLTPKAMGVDSDAMIVAVSDSVQYATIDILAILTIIYLSGVLKYYTVTGGL